LYKHRYSRHLYIYRYKHSYGFMYTYIHSYKFMYT
jgi:hypothetical protein